MSRSLCTFTFSWSRLYVRVCVCMRVSCKGKLGTSWLGGAMYVCVCSLRPHCGCIKREYLRSTYTFTHAHGDTRHYW